MVRNLILFVLLLTLPASALEYRANFLLSGVMGAGVNFVQPLNDYSNLQSGAMLGFAQALPIFLEANYQFYFSDAAGNRMFLQAGFQRIYADNEYLDLIKKAVGWRDPLGLNEKLELALVGGYFPQKNRFGLIGINLALLL